MRPQTPSPTSRPPNTPKVRENKLEKRERKKGPHKPKDTYSQPKNGMGEGGRQHKDMPTHTARLAPAPTQQRTSIERTLLRRKLDKAPTGTTAG
ncbi:hypothetical protein E2C01_012451 [Portunus trituberculatus]|uniref:Uncharacterized protein n=1 Tax=Portunus trituberculatus TaxID=210409 RepID=A0A5B7DEL5_PORTR|nr:hypothetical protein [Portunus trituberculatus]